MTINNLRSGKISIRAATLCAALLTAFVGCGDFIERTYILDDLTMKFVTQNDVECADCGERKVAYGKTEALPSPVRRGYEFVGWYSEPASGGTDYGMGADLYEMDAKNVTMYARWKPYLHMDAGDSVINGITCVFVDSGTFRQGSHPNEGEWYHDETWRLVTLTKPFWIAKYPTTNRQFYEGKPYPANLAGLEDHPVVMVNWETARSFAESIGASLPTEAQWEFAARDGNMGHNHRFIYSGSNNIDEVALYELNSKGGTEKVGGRKGNLHRIYDMSGNVFEWCLDRRGYYDNTSVKDPEGPDVGEGRIHRGGGWKSPQKECRVADRAYSNPNTERDDIGFRVIFPAK